MTTHLLITDAGSGASNNLIRSLRAGDPSFVIVGCHDDQFLLRNSPAERNYLVPPSGHPKWMQALRRVLETERIDLLIPTTDAGVTAVSRVRDKLRGHLFLPHPAVIKLCEDKYRLASFLRAKGVAAPATYVVPDLKQIEDIFRRLGRPSRVWCRIRTGAGAMGAIPVGSPEQARSWIKYWRDMRGVPIPSFTLSEYLSGRDFGCQSLWKDGRLVLVKTYERLSYLGRGSHPGQVSSVAALGKTVVERRVVEVSVKAIRLIDPNASGVFGVDLKEDHRSVPCITEINAGRFSSATNIFDLTGKHNMAATLVRLARGEAVDLDEEYDVTEDYYMLRGLDTVPQIFHADEFFDGIQDARSQGRANQLRNGPR
jgi:carbamoylphosphate synthase large subunit